ncbi:MAG: hypothetical protein ABL949_09085 [Fimbriimonadaceae bacterium]
MQGLKWFRFGCLMVLCGVVLACGGGGSNNTTTPNPVVRFINGSPNSVALSALANDVAIGTSVPYLGSAPNFVTVEAGDYDFLVQEDGAPETQAVEFKSLNRDQDLLAVAVGLVTPPNTELEKRMICTPFTFNRIKPNGDKSKLIVVNGLNRGLGDFNVSIDFQNPGDTPRFRLANIAFAGAGQELIVDAGSDTFVARRTGSELEVTPQKTFTFEGGKIYLALVSGVEGQTGAQAPKITYIELQSRS